MLFIYYVSNLYILNFSYYFAFNRYQVFIYKKRIHYICVYIYVCVYVCVYIYIYIHIYIYIYFCSKYNMYIFKFIYIFQISLNIYIQIYFFSKYNMYISFTYIFTYISFIYFFQISSVLVIYIYVFLCFFNIMYI